MPRFKVESKISGSNKLFDNLVGDYIECETEEEKEIEDISETKRMLTKAGIKSVVKIALRTCLYGDTVLDREILKYMEHIYNMICCEEPMKQLGIEKDCWDLDDDDFDKIKHQIARNNGYEV